VERGGGGERGGECAHERRGVASHIEISAKRVAVTVQRSAPLSAEALAAMCVRFRAASGYALSVTMAGAAPAATVRTTSRQAAMITRPRFIWLQRHTV